MWLRRTVEPNQPLDDLLRRLNATLQGWCGYFRARGVFGSVLLPESLRVADGVALAATKAPQIDLGINCAAVTAVAAGGQPATNGS